MLQIALISIGFAILLLTVWYWAFLRFNRRRAQRLLRWLEGAIDSHGQISGVEWVSPSHIRARLRLFSSAFRQPSLDARFAPRQMPLRWLLWHWRQRQETLTFEANLSYPPRQSVEIGRTRWTGITRRWAHSNSSWPRHPVASLFISTQPDWDPEITARMSGVVSARELDFLAVSFRPRAPHFSVTFSMDETLKRSDGELGIFECLRELAEGSPTSRM